MRTTYATRARDTARRVAIENGVTVHRIADQWGWGTSAMVRRFIHENAIEVVNLQYQAAAYQMHGAINLLPRQLRGAKPAKTFVTFHDLRAPYLFPKAGAVRWRSMLWMARGAHGVIVTNDEDFATLAKHDARSARRQQVLCR